MTTNLYKMGLLASRSLMWSHGVIRNIHVSTHWWHGLIHKLRKISTIVWVEHISVHKLRRGIQ